MGIVAVSATASGAGKTVTTAAVAALELARGRSVAVVKLAQTGLLPGEPGDSAEVERLAPGVVTYEYARYPDALPPEAAARHAGDRALGLTAVAKSVAALDTEFDLVLVEGTGGLLERFGPDGWTVAELAWAVQAPALLVVGTGRDAVGHTALAAEALRSRGVPLAGLVIGSWPKHADLVARCTVTDLETLTGALPAGAPQRRNFLAVACESLDATWGGEFDAAAFRDSADPTPAGTSVTG